MFDNIVMFTQLVEIANFGKAAEKLNVSASTISRKIKELETYLDKQLFIRDTRNIELTEDGRMVYLQFKDLRGKLGKLYESLNHVTRTEKGILNVVLPVEFSCKLITPYLNYFIRMNPDIRVNCTYQFNERDLKSSEIDVLITADELYTQGYIRQLIRTEFIQLYATPEYATKYGLPLQIEDLENHSFIGAIDPITKMPLDYVTFTNRYTQDKFLYNNLDHNKFKVNMALHALDIGLAGDHLFWSWNYLSDDLVRLGKLIKVLPEFYARETAYYMYTRNKHKSVEQIFINFIKRCMNLSIKVDILSEPTFQFSEDDTLNNG